VTEPNNSGETQKREKSPSQSQKTKKTNSKSFSSNRGETESTGDWGKKKSDEGERNRQAEWRREGQPQRARVFLWEVTMNGRASSN